MPFTIAETGPYRMQLMSVVVEMAPDGHFTMQSTQRESMEGKGADRVMTEAGTYTVDGSALALRYDVDGKTTRAQLDCQGFSFQERGGTYVFTK